MSILVTELSADNTIIKSVHLTASYLLYFHLSQYLDLSKELDLSIVCPKYDNLFPGTMLAGEFYIESQRLGKAALNLITSNSKA